VESVRESIEEARRLIGEGREKRAAGILRDAAAECDDPSKAGEIESLALQGRRQAGWFGRKRWDEVLRVLSERSASVT